MVEATFEDLALPHHPRGGAGKAGRSKMFEHERIKGCGSLICTDIFETQGAFMRSLESAEEDGEGMALKI